MTILEEKRNKVLILILCLLFLIKIDLYANNIFLQDSLTHNNSPKDSNIALHDYEFKPTRFRETALVLGLNRNVGTEENKGAKDLYFLELSIWRTKYFGGRHGAFISTYYFANEVGLNTNKFTICPKIGGIFTQAVLLIFSIGAEVGYYTDFNTGSLRFMPSVGIHTHIFKLTAQPHVILTNKNFENVNQLHVNLSIPIYTIDKEEFK